MSQVRQHILTTSPSPVSPVASPWAPGSDNLVCAMVGLPARGKTYIARKLCQWLGELGEKVGQKYGSILIIFYVLYIMIYNYIYSNYIVYIYICITVLHIYIYTHYNIYIYYTIHILYINYVYIHYIYTIYRYYIYILYIYILYIYTIYIYTLCIYIYIHHIYILYIYMYTSSMLSP